MEKTLLYREQNFTQPDVDDVVKFIETLDEKPALIRKICFLTVETLQNIIHHSATRNDKTYAYFELIKEDDSYLIKTGNLIKKEDTDELEKRLRCVTTITEDEIKEKIMNNLENEGFSDKGGAGIGLLSIQKRTGKGMLYEIEYFKDDYNFIHFEIRI
jgi:hypothetical protein